MYQMRINFNLLIICILLICIWFFLSSQRTKSACKMVFVGLMWFAVGMYINRLWGISIEYGEIVCNDTAIIIQKMLHYFFAGCIYAFYAFFMGQLLHKFGRWSTWYKILFCSPTFILDILILTSPWNGAIFVYNNGTFEKGNFFWVMMTIRIIYAVAGTVLALSKRKYLPGVFSKSIIIVSLCTVAEFLFYLKTGDEALFYSSMATNILILVLALTVVEYYKDVQTGLLNLEAFSYYVENKLNGKKDQAVYLVKLKNYNYLKDNCNELSLLGTVKELATCILDYSGLASIYYLGNGRYAIVTSKRSKFKEEEFFNKLEKRFCVPFNVNGANITLSLFVAVINLGNEKINQTNFWKFFTACDNIKYKESGNIEIVYGDNFGVDQLQRYHDVEEAIERALVENEFRMFYQPIVSSEDEKVVSCEALIRLNDRVLGFISPEEFIPISEGNGTILDISEFVIDNVFRFISENDLESLGLKFVEMNLSMIQCMDANLPEKLMYYADKYKIKPEFVNLEITETATSIDESSLKKQLNTIKNLGFSFSLDDFGTGYSNLVRVLEYPVDIIKLDKLIIWSAFHNADNYATLKNLITMFHDVRRKLVAEGVESETQKEQLIELGCDLLQGYYYSKPIQEEEFLQYLKRHK